MQPPSAHKPITVALDAMGGDHAPDAMIECAAGLADETDLQIILVGPAEVVQASAWYPACRSAQVRIAHAAETITDHDDPVRAITSSDATSISVGLQLVAAGTADAFVSAGHSGAIVSGAVFTLKMIKGIERPALCTVVPSRQGQVLLADVGATAVCKPAHLAQWALMTACYCTHLCQVERPRVCLLSNGAESSKGTPTLRRADTLLRHTGLNYRGFIEPNQILAGKTDIAICDGFTGNALIKMAEATAEQLHQAVREQLCGSLAGRIFARVGKRFFQRIGQTFDYAEYGGAPLLGVQGSVVIAHGRSDARALGNAVRFARDYARARIATHLARDPAIADNLQHITRWRSLFDRMFSRRQGS